MYLGTMPTLAAIFSLNLCQVFFYSQAKALLIEMALRKKVHKFMCSS